VSGRQLKKLAKLVFQLTRREIWLGGKGGFNWPIDGSVPGVSWHSETTWTLSPEVELGGHQVRVCVSYNENSDRHGNIRGYYPTDPTGYWHRVKVFVDGEEKYPGGEYLERNRWWWPSWSKRIAMLEHRDGGATGPVDRTDLLIEDAKKKLKAVNAAHTPKQLTVSDFKLDPAYKAAVEEIDRMQRAAKLPEAG
jgi:hypothetical protein